MKRVQANSPGIFTNSGFDHYYDQDYYNGMYSNHRSKMDPQMMYENRFPMDTDLLVDVSTARSSMLELTKGAIESRIIEEIPRELQEQVCTFFIVIIWFGLSKIRLHCMSLLKFIRIHGIEHIPHYV